MNRPARLPTFGPVAACLLLALPVPTRSQEVRVTGVSVVRFVQLRPLESDSVPVETTRGSGLLRSTEDGVLVRCVTGDPFCHFLSTADPLSTVPASQDLYASAWGVGRGIRGYAHLRARSVVAGESSLWPRSDDAFDALEAWVEFARPRYRLRGGRLWKASGLGYDNYDGASVLVRPREGLAVEAFGGWSLARGLSEPRTSDALEAIESFAPDDRGLLVGGEARYRPTGRLALTALYQREIREDREGLYSERVSAAGLYRTARLRGEGSVELDLASRELNEARLRLQGRVAPGFSLEGQVRRYRPFFELWTIWGAFDPVGFDEAGLGIFWQPPERGLAVSARAAWRSYPETHTGLDLTPLRDDGWRLALDGSGNLGRVWGIQAGFLAEVGFGAAKSQERLRVSRQLGEGSHVAASLLAFQSLFEFRVDEGTVLGLSLDGGARITPRTSVWGNLAVYDHGGTGNGSNVDWSQVRASVRFEWTVGPEPGASGAPRDGP